MNKEKIIVIDMVNGFVKEGALHDKRILQLVDPIKELVQEKSNAEILIVEDSHLKNAAEFDSFPEHCLAGTSESKTIDELQYLLNKETNPNLAGVIQKNSTNGFFNLLNKGEINGSDTYYLVGCCTDICVLQLALSLKIYGDEYNTPKKVIVVKDCVSTYDAPNHNAEEYSLMAFKIMEMAGIEIKTKEEIINGSK